MGKVQFQFWILAPAAPDGHWTVLGEAKKYVAGSRQRFHSVSYRQSASSVALLGAADEKVIVMVLPPKSTRVQYVTCRIDDDGKASLQCVVGQSVCSCNAAGSLLV